MARATAALLALMCAALIPAPWRAAAAAPQTARRVAMVVGNGEYANAPPLVNPERDARAVAAALRRLGFNVREHYNVTKAQFDAALKDFGEAARGADWAVIFYAGHGIAVDGETYLQPVDAQLANADRVAEETTPLSRIRAATSGARGPRLVILDSCRNNPFLERMQSEGGGRAIGPGLARPQAPEGGEMVVYATGETAIAEDGGGPHSPFTAALLRHLEEPGLEVELLFEKVRGAVMEATDRTQVPTIYSSPGRGPFYFTAPPAGQDFDVRDVVGMRGKPIPLAIAPPALRGKNDAYIGVEGLPKNAKLSKGRRQGGGLWTLRFEDLDGLSVRLPDDAPAETEAEAAIYSRDNAKGASRRFRIILADQPVVAVGAVRGAPGDGGAALAEALKAQLVQQGLKIEPGDSGGVYLIRGQVKIDAPENGQQAITIHWSVRGPSKRMLERAAFQENHIPAGSLDGPWGEAANEIAAEAAKILAPLIRNDAQHSVRK